MFHSAARSTQGAQITEFKPEDRLVTIVDPCPQGKTRMIALTAAGKSSRYGTQPPALGFQCFDDGATGDVFIYLKDASGQLFFILSGSVVGQVVFSVGSVVLAPGESLVAEVDLQPTVVATKITALAYYVDIQGPFAHKRTPIGADWQDIIPSPGYGKIHTPIGSFISPNITINGYAVIKDETGGSIQERVMVDGKRFGAVSIAGAAPAIVFPFLQASIDFAPLFGVIPLPYGWSIQARSVPGATGAVGTVAFASYLVTNDPKVHRSV